MQTLDNNVPQNQKQDEQAQPLIESQVSKEGEAEQAGRAKTENDGPSQAVLAAGSTSSSDPSATAITSTSDQPKPSTTSAAANESPSAPNISTAANPSSSTHHPPPAPKRFSSATISKQFLHKATSGAGSKSDSSSQHAKPAPSTSALGGNSRPAQPTPAAHPSRLVTAKLTINGPSSASSTGWNTPRPNSATNTANPSPVQTPGVTAPSSKQIVPLSANANPSSEWPNSATKNGTSGKPWGDMRKVPASVPVVNAASDFPTAAEVARGKSSQVVKPPKQLPPQLTTDGASKTPLNESEDAFRGVHLDPKAHHWDDDEADDDNYLGEVVEFADGMQYSVPPTATAESHPSTGLQDAPLPTSLKLSSEAGENDAPIRKEDRFPDDFDRSWPKGRGSSHAADSPGMHPRELPSPAPSHSTLHSEHGDRGNRVLFNERSNRMEPAHPPWGRRDNDGPPSRGGRFPNRERPPYSRDRWASGNEHPSQAPNGRPPRNDRNPNYGGNRRTDMPPPPPPGSQSMEGPSWGRSSYRRQSNASQDDPPRMTGPGSRSRQPYQDTERDFHRPGAPSGAPSRLETSSSRTPRWPDQRPLDRPPPFGSGGRRESVASSVHKSPLLQSGSIAGEPVSPHVENGSELTPMPANPIDPTARGEKLAALTKSEMHNAAQRARERRLKEEEERQKQQERAKAKAAAIAAQQEEAAKAAEEEKRRQEEEQRRQEEQRAKEEAEKLERERKEAEEKERSSSATADPLSVKPLSGGRPKLQLLPRTIPLPAPPPPEPTTARRKETKLPGDVTPLPGSAVTAVFRSLAEKHDDDIQVVDYENMDTVMGGPSPQRQSEFSGGKPSPTDGASPSGNATSTTLPPTSPARKSQAVVPPSPSFSNTRHAAVTSPVSTRYREAPLASVSETMSRLKGVLKSMAGENRQDDFAVSIPSSEPVLLSSSKIVVKISTARIGQSSAPVKVKETRPPRDKALQIQSFDPPIVNLNPATLSRDETIMKGVKSRAAVVKLPAAQRSDVRAPSSGPSAAQRGPPPPKVGFGRGNRADEGNWRKPKEPKIEQAGPLPVQEVEVLSRSPHPIITDISESAIVHVPSAGPEREGPVSSPTTSPRGSKGKPPSGVDVSFYRSPSMEMQNPVRFTVTSEIEATADPASAGLTVTTADEPKVEEKKLDETPSSQSGSTLLTPPLAPATTAWEKSPLGFPVSPLNAQAGSDGLKAVWESAASAAGTSTENSLRGIVDELPPTIPMSVQELGSGDGGNKSDPGLAVAVASSVVPEPPAPKRSLQDAHRAFQIVPKSPANATNPPPYAMPPPTTTPQRPADPNPAMLPPSPYMMAGQPPFPAPNGYARPPYSHPAPPTPNMMWAQPPNQYVPNGSLSVRQQTPGGTGPSPPLPQQVWMGQQSQQVPPGQFPPQFQGVPQFNYMQSPGMQAQQKATQNMGPPMNHLGVGGPHSGPHNAPPMNYSNPAMGQHLPPQGQGFQHRPPHMTSPNLYNASPVISSPGYNPAMQGPNRNMGRTGFELPPPATPQLYPQLQNRPFHPPGWSFAS